MAIEIWKHHAGAIEAHLAFRGIDIADWHQGTLDDKGRPVLSSRRLLTLLEHIPETGGRWPISLKIAKDTQREVALHRAALYAGGENEYDPEFWIDPEEGRALADRLSDEAEQVAESSEGLYSGLGFT